MYQISLRTRLPLSVHTYAESRSNLLSNTFRMPFRKHLIPHLIPLHLKTFDRRCTLPVCVQKYAYTTRTGRPSCAPCRTAPWRHEPMREPRTKGQPLLNPWRVFFNCRDVTKTHNFFFMRGREPEGRGKKKKKKKSKKKRKSSLDFKKKKSCAHIRARISSSGGTR